VLKEMASAFEHLNLVEVGLFPVGRLLDSKANMNMAGNKYTGSLQLMASPSRVDHSLPGSVLLTRKDMSPQKHNEQNERRIIFLLNLIMNLSHYIQDIVQLQLNKNPEQQI
jgi:hypothetical protein